ncbi:hypothetical protein GDO78_003265 [Eleutherodactylus coqui]|uniref:Uncharacterized protein n=1 Tax=Eleutherodactylus coqui TaxID=57060 RepID=A0A8J6K0L9_ELECQ|nr:hypothetical protein GDO78_003265 [Eleutherodactylus coqui]
MSSTATCWATALTSQHKPSQPPTHEFHRYLLRHSSPLTAQTQPPMSSTTPCCATALPLPHKPSQLTTHP